MFEAWSLRMAAAVAVHTRALLQCRIAFAFTPNGDHAIGADDIDNDRALFLVVHSKPVPALLGW